ncbi:MAG: hypothetical protein PUP92_28980 [Rhizonema sp. PD38]|nr:hypothetical protein [Rhizonema sp. PD38]
MSKAWGLRSMTFGQKPLKISLAGVGGGDDDWHEKIVKWAQAQEGTTSREAILLKWLEVMGKKPSIKQVELLQEYLTQMN